MRGLMAALFLALGVLFANSWLRKWIRVEKIAPPKGVAATPPGWGASAPDPKFAHRGKFNRELDREEKLEHLRARTRARV